MKTHLDVNTLIERGRFGEAFFRARDDLEIMDDPWARAAMFDACVALCRRVYLPRKHIAKAARCIEIMGLVAPGMHDPRAHRIADLYELGELCHPLAPALRALLTQAATQPGIAYEQLRRMEIPLCLHNVAAQLLSVCAASHNCFTSLATASIIFSHYLSLQPLRPSLTHSLMLGHAIDLATRIPAFDFHEFLQKWNVANFRPEDMESDGALCYRCAALLANQLRFSSFPVFINGSAMGESEATDLLAEALFRKLQLLGKRNLFSQLWQALIAGLKMLSPYPPTYWHSALIEMAQRLHDADPDSSLLTELSTVDTGATS